VPFDTPLKAHAGSSDKLLTSVTKFDNILLGVSHIFLKSQTGLLMKKHTSKKVLTVFFYQDKPGKAPALEFIERELDNSNSLY
jgi:hypothetical protein